MRLDSIWVFYQQWFVDNLRSCFPALHILPRLRPENPTRSNLKPNPQKSSILIPQSTSRPVRPHPNTHKRPKPNPTLQIPTSDAFFYFRPKNSQISHHKPIPSSSKNLPSPNRFTSQSFPRQLPHSRESRNLVHEHHIQIVAPTILFFNFFSIVCISIETQNKKYVDHSQFFFYFVPQQSRRQAGPTMPVSSFLTSNIEATAWKNIRARIAQLMTLMFVILSKDDLSSHIRVTKLWLIGELTFDSSPSSEIRQI